MRKDPNGVSWSPIRDGCRPVRKFRFLKGSSTFNLLTFNPSQHPETKERYPEEKSPENEYSPVYVNLAELTSLRWGFNSRIMEPMSGGISRSHNQHLFK